MEQVERNSVLLCISLRRSLRRFEHSEGWHAPSQTPQRPFTSLHPHSPFTLRHLSHSEVMKTSGTSPTKRGGFLRALWRLKDSIWTIREQSVLRWISLCEKFVIWQLENKRGGKVKWRENGWGQVTFFLGGGVKFYDCDNEQGRLTNPFEALAPPTPFLQFFSLLSMRPSNSKRLKPFWWSRMERQRCGEIPCRFGVCWLLTVVRDNSLAPREAVEDVEHDNEWQ